jgi:hypothetical protein
VEPKYFTPFGRKRLQTAPEAAGEAMPNGTLGFPASVRASFLSFFFSFCVEHVHNNKYPPTVERKYLLEKVVHTQRDR